MIFKRDIRVTFFQIEVHRSIDPVNGKWRQYTSLDFINYEKSSWKFAKSSEKV
ncbi:MAG: hypothetical protein Ta2E_12200 [Mycoplasmoidaceae bacterium]|nr:MAG: hypothetical protein Ta2E_12200 [Mycoplasmoidaceae bacterium]